MISILLTVESLWEVVLYFHPWLTFFFLYILLPVMWSQSLIGRWSQPCLNLSVLYIYKWRSIFWCLLGPFLHFWWALWKTEVPTTVECLNDMLDSGCRVGVSPVSQRSWSHHFSTFLSLPFYVHIQYPASYSFTCKY